MNNDLISRKAVVDLIDKLGYINVSNHDDFRANCRMDKIRQEVSELPTSFDKEKVIEKLKEKYNYSRKVRNKNDNDYFEYWDGRTDSYKDAIEIVEKGGIE